MAMPLSNFDGSGEVSDAWHCDVQPSLSALLCSGAYSSWQGGAATLLPADGAGAQADARAAPWQNTIRVMAMPTIS
ncbi:MAG: hypothetical protein KF804_08175 [Burkholderiales bacterium]|nr:hypothetical protein [Burkholderiales bacterium]